MFVLPSSSFQILTQPSNYANYRPYSVPIVRAYHLVISATCASAVHRGLMTDTADNGFLFIRRDVTDTCSKCPTSDRDRARGTTFQVCTSRR